jgi:opacity protein-like surface antigen
VLATEQTSVSLYAGARLNWLDVSASLNRVDGGVVNNSGDEYWNDAIVGVRFRQHLRGPWFLRLTGDIGAGDSDLTWQALGILEYQLRENLSVGLGYRWVDTDYKNAGFTYDVQASGLVLGVEKRF